MPLAGPNAADVEKLNQEINQIVNQRFLLATAAITIFGAFVAALVAAVTVKPEGGSSAAVADLIGGISSGSSVVLFILFLMHQMLQGTLRTIATYLIETNASGWQCDWKLYRTHYRWDYIAPNAFIFFITNTLIVGSLVLTADVFPDKISFCQTPFVLAFCITAAIEICIPLMSMFKVLEREEWSQNIWKTLNSK
jgi:hypothetical protein